MQPNEKLPVFTIPIGSVTIPPGFVATIPPGPRVLPPRYTCEGCPLFKAEYWNNGDGDSGTYAQCTHFTPPKGIASYWYSQYPPPAWCPFPVGRTYEFTS